MWEVSLRSILVSILVNSSQFWSILVKQVLNLVKQVLKLSKTGPKLSHMAVQTSISSLWSDIAVFTSVF